MTELKIYRISEQYIHYMHSHDFRVQFNKDQRRPYVGVVLSVGHYRYFVPMESPRPSHARLRSSPHILKLAGGQLGLLGFNNMLPVPDCALIPLDIDAEPDAQYKDLLQRQSRQIVLNSSSIFERAMRTYLSVTERKIPFLCRISCDFKALEQACDTYRP